MDKTMNIERINQLLQRYYDGLATADEERELRDCMTSASLPAQLQEERDYYLALDEAAQVPDGLANRLFDKIDEWAAGEKKAEKPSRTVRKVVWMRWMGVAASIALVLGVARYATHRPSEAILDTCSSPEEAYAITASVLTRLSQDLNGEKAYDQTERALSTFSTNLNRGMNDVEKYL